MNELERTLELESPEEAVRAFVLCLDGMADNEWARRLVTRAVVALGEPFLEKHPGHPTVTVTIEAARHFLAEPTQANEDAYFEAATNSYPYGVGEGCYSILDPAAGCKGSACGTGAGTIWNIAYEIGWQRAVEILKTLVSASSS